MWACSSADHFINAHETKKKRGRKGVKALNCLPVDLWCYQQSWATVKLAHVLILMQTSAPPESFSHTPLPAESSECCVAKCSMCCSQLEPGHSEAWACVWAAEWSLSSLKSQSIHLQPLVAAGKLTSYHPPPPPLLFSNQKAVGCIISLTSAIWGGVNLLITTQGHI